MKRNRLICLAFIAAAAVFASFFGGAFSYALFYASLAVPLTCFVYLLFVFIRLKIYQAIDSKIVVKGAQIGYKYILSNETTIHFTNIEIEFLDDYSRVEMPETQGGISLAPFCRIEEETNLICLYRGEYEVGISAVIVRDYLGLFALRREYPASMNLRVYPRIVKLNSLGALCFGDDVKSLPFSLKQGQEQDTDLRAFTLGDSVKAVNWKVSAKHGELYTRRRTEPPKEKIVIIIDTSPVEGEKKIPAEDKILEAALAIADFELMRGIETEIIFYADVLSRFLINSREDFSRFYDACLSLSFSGYNTAKYSADAAVENAAVLVLITADCREFIPALSRVSAFMNTCVILIGNRENTELSALRESLGKTALVHIPDDTEAGGVLERGIL
ncbi:MAG: DUF58 domain-containing protein [Oscillospiraceae bacterium]|jgi:uncharacterized protein (DUF58 family)|nr:DUF58 domain-containing protein [Oscillospiraceae bacterium]